jgi:hypothetical protein
MVPINELCKNKHVRCVVVLLNFKNKFTIHSCRQQYMKVETNTMVSRQSSTIKYHYLTMYVHQLMSAMVLVRNQDMLG